MWFPFRTRTSGECNAFSILLYIFILYINASYSPIGSSGDNREIMHQGTVGRVVSFSWRSPTSANYSHPASPEHAISSRRQPSSGTLRPLWITNHLARLSQFNLAQSWRLYRNREQPLLACFSFYTCLYSFSPHCKWVQRDCECQYFKWLNNYTWQ